MELVVGARFNGKEKNEGFRQPEVLSKLGPLFWFGSAPREKKRSFPRLRIYYQVVFLCISSQRKRKRGEREKEKEGRERSRKKKAITCSRPSTIRDTVRSLGPR